MPYNRTVHRTWTVNERSLVKRQGEAGSQRKRRSKCKYGSNRMVSVIWYQHGIGDRTLSARGDVLLGKPESSPSSSSSSDSPPTASSSPGRDAVRAMRGHRPLAGGGQAHVVGFSKEDELVSGQLGALCTGNACACRWHDLRAISANLGATSTRLGDLELAERGEQRSE